MPKRLLHLNGRLLTGFLVGGAVSFFLAIAAFAYLTTRRADENATARKALCAQRSDLDQRIATTKRILEAHQHGPVFGIPRSVLLSSLRQSVVTRRNLDILDCG